VIKRHNHRMFSGYPLYIWQKEGWPELSFDAPSLSAKLGEVTRGQGLLYGRLTDVGLVMQDQTRLQMLTEEVLRTSEIEGERLDTDSVRSSIARQLGMDIGALAPVDRDVEGIVQIVLDATTHYQQPLTLDRLFGWHAALFPTGFSGLSPIDVGEFRSDVQGPMQVISGAYGKQRIHFQAPPAKAIAAEVRRFIAWFETPHDPNLLHPVIKAGMAHFWFVTLHPFDDGNGRIARAIGDLALARADGTSQRFYSLSAQIQKERKHYYEQLERTQKGDLDITPWLDWFLSCLHRALQAAHSTVGDVLQQTRFWQHWAGTAFNERQIKILRMLHTGFVGKLTSSKWALLCKCSSDTALRDIQTLITLGVLTKSEAGGRSASYELKPC
jgi:Fic family protein